MWLRMAVICPLLTERSIRCFPTACCSISRGRMSASHCKRLPEHWAQLEASLCKCQIALAFAVFIIKPAAGSARATTSTCVTGLLGNWSRPSVIFGSAHIFVDGFFSLNPQISDVSLLPWKYRAVVYASEALRKISGILSPLTYVADSLYVKGTGRNPRLQKIIDQV